MKLNFPNPSRSFDSARQCVCFWGHQSQFEIAFQIDAAALDRIQGSAVPAGEASLLQAFDRNRDRIEKAAALAFSRRNQNLVRLSESDF